jgi:transposase
MSKNRAKRYNAEFKEQVIARIVKDGHPLASTAKDFGVTEQTVRNWLRVSEERKIPERVRASELEAELKKAQRRIADLEMTNEILKKAAAIFATSNQK